MTDDLGGNVLPTINDLPIRPGSDVDAAINAVVAHHVSAEPSPIGFDALRLINPSDSAQMLALGTRLWFGGVQVNDPRALTAELYEQWYGKAIPR